MDLTIRDITQISLMAALTAIGAYISIPIGAVPITLQTMFVLMSGIILGSKRGAIAQMIYMIVGLIGLPVFAGGNGGVGGTFNSKLWFCIGFYCNGLHYRIFI